MSFITATAAQRLAVRDACAKLAKLVQGLIQSAEAPNAGQGALVDAAIVPVTAALAGVGTGATQAIVTDAQELTGVTPTGVYVDTVTFTVAGGAITAITLS